MSAETLSSPKVAFGKRWLDADLAGWLVDWSVKDDTLHLVLDYALLRAARKDQSVATARWRIGETVYHTTLVTVLPAHALVRVAAAVPHTPLPSAMRTQAGLPWKGPTTRPSPSAK